MQPSEMNGYVLVDKVQLCHSELEDRNVIIMWTLCLVQSL